MLFSKTSFLAAVLACASVIASPVDTMKRENGIAYLGSTSSLLSGGTKFGNLVFVSGQVPFVNGTIAEGGIKNETAVCLERVGEILKEAGTDWSKVLKVNVFLQDINDYAAMNEVYEATLPNPKPARVALQVANLPVPGISVEIDAIA